MKLLMIQPGAFGDIILCSPIAKWYFDMGYKVVWPAREKFQSILSALNYVSPILLNDETLDVDWLKSDVMKILPLSDQYDLVINLADRGPHPTAQQGRENFEQCKYRLANVPIEEKHRLSWTRNRPKENALYELMVGQKKEYTFCHLESSKGDRAELPPDINGDIVEASLIDGYSIYDWYKVIINSKKIFCVESSIHQFIDGFINSLNAPCYVLSRSTLSRGESYTYSPFWDKTYIK